MIQIHAKLFKQLQGHSDFLPPEKQSIYAVGEGIASTITSRYYKGIGGHGDNLIVVIHDEEKESKLPY